MKQYKNDFVLNSLDGLDFFEIILVLSALDFNKNLYEGINLADINDNFSDGDAIYIHPGCRIDS